MDGLVLTGYVLTMLLCRLDGLKPVECRPMHPQPSSTRTECELKLANILETFPRVQPEALGLPAGTRMHIVLRCRPLYGDYEALRAPEIAPRAS